MKMTESKFITVKQASKRYAMCRQSLLKVADSVGAIRRFGRMIRIDVDAMERQPDNAEQIGK